ncbi:hypothetical protein ACN47E_003579 [Coniothyrium glycines]
MLSFISTSHLLLGTGVINLGLVAAAPRLFSRDGSTPLLTTDPKTTKYCTWWVDVASDYPCASLVEDNFITLADFRRWNPSITAECGGVTVGHSYCVEVSQEEPPPSNPTSSSATPSKTPVTSSTKAVITTPSPTPKPSSTAAPTTTSAPGNGISTPSPAQPTIVSNCDAFYFVKSGDTCDAIAAANGITAAQFAAWNPSAGTGCAGLWANAYACISIIGHTPTSAAPSTTKPGNGISTPTPVQSGMVSNCDSFYKVVSGDTCDVAASKNGVSSAQIISWNPAVGSNCAFLQLGVYICVSTVGHTPTPTQPGNGIATPTPYQTGMTTNCKKFHFVAGGETCAIIASKYSITVENFAKWNPAVGGTNCGGLWSNTYACVGV